MVEEICLDTDVCIAILRDEERAKFVLDAVKEHKVAISAVTVFELMLRKTNLAAVEDFVGRLEQLSFDSSVARAASDLHKELSRKGGLIDIRDLFIAATCLTHRCKLLTFNEKHFKRIAELKMVELNR